MFDDFELPLSFYAIVPVLFFLYFAVSLVMDVQQRREIEPQHNVIIRVRPLTDEEAEMLDLQPYEVDWMNFTAKLRYRRHEHVLRLFPERVFEQ